MFERKNIIIICLVLLLLVESVVLAMTLKERDELKQQIQSKDFANYYLGNKMTELTEIMEIQKDLLDARAKEVELLETTVKELK